MFVNSDMSNEETNTQFSDFTYNSVLPVDWPRCVLSSIFHSGHLPAVKLLFHWWNETGWCSHAALIFREIKPYGYIVNWCYHASGGSLHAIPVYIVILVKLTHMKLIECASINNEKDNARTSGTWLLLPNALSTTHRVARTTSVSFYSAYKVLLNSNYTKFDQIYIKNMNIYNTKTI